MSCCLSQFNLSQFNFLSKFLASGALDKLIDTGILETLCQTIAPVRTSNI